MGAWPMSIGLFFLKLLGERQQCVGKAGWWGLVGSAEMGSLDLQCLMIFHGVNPPTLDEIY